MGGGVTTGGAPSMIARKTGLMGRITKNWTVPNFIWNFTASYTKSLCGEKTLKFEHVMKTVVSDVNFFRSHDLTVLFCRN
jgi:hypothetical protein